MPTTTLNAIRAHGPCADGWAKLLRHLGKTAADDEPLDLRTIINNNGIKDALWCLRAMPEHAQHWRLYAVWCARQAQHLMTDPRSIEALAVAKRHAHGDATDAQLAAACSAAWAAAYATTGGAARAAAAAAVAAAAWAATALGAIIGGASCGAQAAGAFVRAVAWDAARAAAASGVAASEAAFDDAMAAAWNAATQRLREVCDEIDSEVQP